MKVKSLIAMSVVLVGLLLGPGALALEMIPVAGIDVTSDFKGVYDKTGRVGYIIKGASFSKAGEDVSGLNWLMKREDKLLRAFLIWGGDVQSYDENRARRIVLHLPNGEDESLEAEFFWKVEVGRQLAYSAMVDVTRFMKRNGSYGVSGLKSAANKFSGYAIVGVYGSQRLPMRQLSLTVGISRLKPGEIYDVHLGQKKIPGVVSRVSTFGGNGKAGNGSANILNGVTLSGGEDWDGSSGLQWDVDDFRVRRFQVSSTKGIIWSVDPLLQWVYPIGIAVQTDLKELKVGEKR